MVKLLVNPKKKEKEICNILYRTIYIDFIIVLSKIRELSRILLVEYNDLRDVAVEIFVNIRLVGI